GEIRFGERLIDTGLIGAKGTTALQQQGDSLERRSFFRPPARLPGRLKRTHGRNYSSIVPATRIGTLIRTTTVDHGHAPVKQGPHPCFAQSTVKLIPKLRFIGYGRRCRSAGPLNRAHRTHPHSSPTSCPDTALFRQIALGLMPAMSDGCGLASVHYWDTD